MVASIPTCAISAVTRSVIVCSFSSSRAKYCFACAGEYKTVPVGEAAALQMSHVFPCRRRRKLQEQTSCPSPPRPGCRQSARAPLCLSSNAVRISSSRCRPTKVVRPCAAATSMRIAPGLSASELEHLHRVMALERRCAQRLKGKIPLRQAIRGLADQDGARLRLRLEPGCRTVVSSWAV